MRRKYLSSIDLQELILYCRKNAIKIVIEHHAEDRERIKYYRKLYSGYVYGKKIAAYIKKMNMQITNTELYNHLKIQKNSISTERGTVLSSVPAKIREIRLIRGCQYQNPDFVTAVSLLSTALRSICGNVGV